MRRNDRLKSDTSHRADDIQKILKLLVLDQPRDTQIRSPPADLTNPPTALFWIQEHRLRTGDRGGRSGRVRLVSEFDGWIAIFLSDQRRFKSAQGDGW